VQVKQLPMGDRQQVGRKPRFEQVFHQDFRHCDCEMPMVTKKWNEALGTMVAVRLCCLAKAVEELTGKRLYEVHEFDPRWEWDCDQIQECADPDGSNSVVYRPRGEPPKWLAARLKKKGLPIHNEPGA